MQTNDVTANQVAALRSLVSDLERLEDLLARERAAEFRALEAFAHDGQLKELEKLLKEQHSEFDALDFIGKLVPSVAWEKFHSGVLAWLLDPKGSHGLGDKFLRRFLACVGVRTASADWSSTSVQREWYNEVDDVRGYLDILVLNEPEQTLCAIENKTFSEEHSEQLTRYRKALENRYTSPNFSKHYVFLTPHGSAPHSEEERKRWTTATYATTLDVLREIIEDIESPPKEPVRAFLRQYQTTVRRNIVPETSVQQMARKIYLEHRDAIELINRYKPDFIAETKPLFKEAISRHPGWTVTHEESKFFNIRPDIWAPPDAIPGLDRLLRFSFHWGFDGSYPRLGLVASPVTDANRQAREKLHQACLRHGGRFHGTHRLGDSWSWLVWTDPILGESDYSNWQDQAAIRAKIEAWIDNFIAKDFPAMNEVIVNCLREYEAEQQGQ